MFFNKCTFPFQTLNFLSPLCKLHKLYHMIKTKQKPQLEWVKDGYGHLMEVASYHRVSIAVLNFYCQKFGTPISNHLIGVAAQGWCLPVHVLLLVHTPFTHNARRGLHSICDMKIKYASKLKQIFLIQPNQV